jgi:Rrf2 family transcriptional regulator, iron-sulfur cluster assembly transcription factor
MALKTRTGYALRALLEISGEAGASLSAETICERQKLPKKYIEHLLSSLRKAGLIKSSAGSLGGYSLAKPAGGISLYDVVEAVGDHSWQLDCHMDKRHCLGGECGLVPLFRELAQKQRELLESYTLDRIMEFKAKEKK